jgi:hypothetical protein
VTLTGPIGANVTEGDFLPADSAQIKDESSARAITIIRIFFIIEIVV